MAKNKERTTINIYDEYFPIYQNIIDKDEWKVGDNLKLFTISVLIGKYICNEKISIENHVKGFLRVKDNAKKDEMVLLKSFAIMESGDINIIKDEDAMFSICEQYTTAGILKLKEWYESKEQDIIETLSEELTEKFNDNTKEFFSKNNN